ncbi:hypothetical protein C8R11_102293 [Nitrosomonas aestuarii]|nr:hypothetical protein C8R11_102293 [Nitrosomonas aestuarii]
MVIQAGIYGSYEGNLWLIDLFLNPPLKVILPCAIQLIGCRLIIFRKVRDPKPEVCLEVDNQVNYCHD